jgi:capsular exopolysaccharide synthesis family protein
MRGQRSFLPVPQTTAPEPPVIPLDVALPSRDGEEPRIVEWLRLLLRGWRWLAGGAALFVAATGLYVFTKTPLYTAEAKILIERQAPQVLEMREIVADGLSGDESNYYRTQEEILESRSLAIAVLRELDLAHDPGFAGEDAEPGPIGRAYAWVRAAVARLAPGRAPSAGDGTEEGLPASLIDKYQGNLSVDPITRTRLSQIRFTSPDPRLASQIVNAHVDAYIQQGLRLRSEAGEEARNFLATKLEELRERLEDSEISLNSYRREKGILSLDDRENIVVDRLSDLNKLVSDAEAKRIVLEAEVKLIQSRDYDSLPAVAESALIQTLKSQLGDVERKYVELAARFKPAYPAVEEAQAELRGMSERLDIEIRKVVAAIESAYLAAVDNETQLRERMDEQKSRVLELKDAAVQYAVLKRESDANRELYESVLQRMKEVGVAAAVRASNVSVIDPAIAPRFPSEPRKARALALALFAGTMVGAAVVFARNHLDSSIKSCEDVERHLRLASLGIVPDFAALPASEMLDAPPRSGSERSGSTTRLSLVPRSERPAGGSLILSRDPNCVVTESYRTLRTAILFSQPEAPPKTMLFTSALESEGKTTSALNTALVFAKMGARVLVIDADLRRAKCHERLGVGNLAGLTEALTGQRVFGDVIRRTSVENVDLLSSGSLPPNPTELLGSRAMAELLKQAAARYDFVFIDSPPVMPVNDAVVLSPLVDGVVLVVRAHGTPRQIIQRAENRLAQARAALLGVVLNKLDARSDNYATYYGGRYYSSYYHRVPEEGAA